MEMYGEEWAARFEEYADASIAGRDGLFRLAAAALADLPETARILVVGCGTGSEILALASRHAGWRFEAVEPAEGMLAICRQRLKQSEMSHRVTLHQAGLEGLRLEPCDGATAILVSQHIVDDPGASRFFSEIAENLIHGATLFSADITLPEAKVDAEGMLRTWRQQAVASGLPEDAPASLLARFGKDLVARSPAGVEALLSSAGFRSPLQVFQSTMYRAWISHLTSP
jgi:tRNA (cmo5U34)-methyltransferase